jgi:heme oxygenase (biliverdin-producing, ferredoxin)
MLEKTDAAGRLIRPAGLLEALRERTRELHTQAERSGIIADILQGRATRHDYALLLHNLLPVYLALERHLVRRGMSPPVAPIVRPELMRATALEQDISSLSVHASDVTVLPETATYIDAIEQASGGDGSRLVAHAYARYLGDLSGGQIVKRLLSRSLNLPASALSFYDFPAIADIPAFKSEYRASIDRAGDESEDFEAIVEEGARAFELNIALSVALQAKAARSRP